MTTMETIRVDDRHGQTASRVTIVAAIGSVVVERYLDDDGSVCRVYRTFERTVPVDDVWAVAENCVRTEQEWAGRF